MLRPLPSIPHSRTPLCPKEIACRPAAAVALALGTTLALGACGSSATTATPVGPTLITAEPSAFGAEALCHQGLQKYVVTLVDVSVPATNVNPMGTADATAPFVLPSSPPTDCTVSVSFAYVFPGDEYVALIDGYARSDIAPFGGPQSGSRVMVDPTGAPVAPDFTTSCGEVPAALGGSTFGDAGAADDVDAAVNGGAAGDMDAASSNRRATRAVSTATVFLHDCEPLARVATTADAGVSGEGGAPEAGGEDGGARASIAVDLTALLGSLTCGPGTGQIDHFVVTSAAGSAPLDGLPTVVPCGQNVTLSGPPSGADVELAVGAFEATAAATQDASADDAATTVDAASPDGATTAGAPLATWGTTCTGSAVAGPTQAACAPLVNTGAIHVAIAPLLAQLGHQCIPSDVQSYRVALQPASSSTAAFAPIACSSDATLTDLAPGPRAIDLTGVGASDGGLDTPLFEACCTATVEPGRTAEAACAEGACSLESDAASTEAAAP